MIADVEKPKAQSYVGRTCAHFAHKLPFEQNGAVGTVTFEVGRCEPSADRTMLHLRVTPDVAAPEATRVGLNNLGSSRAGVVAPVSVAFDPYECTVTWA